MPIIVILMVMIISLFVLLTVFNIIEKKKKVQELNQKQNIQKPPDRPNLIGIIIRYFSYITLILGLISSITVLLNKNLNGILAIYILIIDVITFMFFIGLSEIIILLDKINKK